MLKKCSKNFEYKKEKKIRKVFVEKNLKGKILLKISRSKFCMEK
jgi:hypothetical protein